MSKKTASGLGTYITDYKVTDLIEVYRMDGLLAPNAVALAGVVATQTKNNTVRSAIVYENLPGIFDNPSDMPKYICSERLNVSRSCLTKLSRRVEMIRSS